ncbi:hypothetical protein GE09DRAFT_1065875 [Coniochaeta sp. 2T2.1]|nr:hypothetical protein GE09DRAFT_1065875 [Coniochaeta sp. 2T2.1]
MHYANPDFAHKIMANPNPSHTGYRPPDNPDTPFDPNSPADFERWMAPLLLHTIFYGRLPQPPVEPTLRKNFRQVAERMLRGSLPTNVAIAIRANAGFRTVYTMMCGTPQRVAMINYVKCVWPEPITHSLAALDGWNPDGTPVEQPPVAEEAPFNVNTFRPQQTYFMRQEAFQNASLAATLEEFERMTLQDVQSMLPDQTMDGADSSQAESGQMLPNQENSGGSAGYGGGEVDDIL